MIKKTQKLSHFIAPYIVKLKAIFKAIFAAFFTKIFGKAKAIQNDNNNGTVYTFGCRLNAYESQVMNDFAKKYDIQNKVAIINSCAVTNKTESEIIRFVKKYKKQNPDKKLIFTGCGVQSNPQKYNKIAEVDYIIGNSEKMQDAVFQQIAHAIHHKTSFDTSGFVNNSTLDSSDKKHQDIVYQKAVGSTSLYAEGRAIVNDIMSVKETASHLIQSFEGQTRAFIEIQNGCNHRCTFCIIPFGRGNSRSAPLGDIVQQINELTAKGFKEIVLTGVDLTDYGKDLPNKITLSQGIKRILQLCPQLERLRLSSIDVAEADDELFEILQTNQRFMPYFHISLQSGDDMVLKQMARRHTKEQLLNFCNKVRRIRPDALFGGDIIAAFPTETEQAFQNSLDIIKQARICFGHIFTFSPKTGTPAAKMKQIDNKIAKERTKALIQESNLVRLQEYQNIVNSGKILTVLTEQNNLARCQNFALVKIQNNANNKTKALPANQILQVRPILATQDYIVCETC